MHHGLAADIDLLDLWCVSPIGELFDHTFAKCRTPFGVAEYEAFFAKSLPFDRLQFTERMVVRERDKQALTPQWSDVAISSLARIRHKRHIKLSLSDKRNLLRRCPFDKLNSHVRMSRGILLQQFPKKASRDRRPDANAQLPGCAFACFAGNFGRLIEMHKGVPGLPQEASTCVSNRHATPVPFKDRHPQLILKRTHTTAHRRLPYAKRTCRASEAHVLGHDESLCDSHRVNP